LARRALTIDGGSALTPEYAAPEQVAGGAVTTATDAYARGHVVRLLTGQHPFAAARRSAAELLKAITETDPRDSRWLPAATDCDAVCAATSTPS
jgi:serine/threonine-protein kinase